MVQQKNKSKASSKIVKPEQGVKAKRQTKNAQEQKEREAKSKVEKWDNVDQASWETFPASDAPGW